MGLYRDRKSAIPLRAIQPAFERGLSKDLFCADRGITQAKPHNLHLQLLTLGLNAVKHYNDDKVDRQGEFRGMQLIGGEFYCPLMPAPLITAGATYIDSRTDEDRAHALNLIQSRKDYQAKIKEYGPAGDQRRQCPALGSHATVTCYRRPQPRPSTVVDLDASTVRTPAALPTIPRPKRDIPVYPDICRGKSITVPGTVLAKWRQVPPVHPSVAGSLVRTAQSGRGRQRQPQEVRPRQHRQSPAPPAARTRGTDPAQCRHHLCGEPKSHPTVPPRPGHPAPQSQHAERRTPTRWALRPAPGATASDRAGRASATRVTHLRRAPPPENPTCLRHVLPAVAQACLVSAGEGSSTWTATASPPHRADHEPRGPRKDEIPVSHMTRPVIRERFGTIS